MPKNKNSLSKHGRFTWCIEDYFLFWVFDVYITMRKNHYDKVVGKEGNCYKIANILQVQLLFIETFGKVCRVWVQTTRVYDYFLFLSKVFCNVLCIFKNPFISSLLIPFLPGNKSWRNVCNCQKQTSAFSRFWLNTILRFLSFVHFELKSFHIFL